MPFLLHSQSVQFKHLCFVSMRPFAFTSFNFTFIWMLHGSHGMHCNFQKGHSNDNKSGFVTTAEAAAACNNWCRQSRSSRTSKSEWALWVSLCERAMCNECMWTWIERSSSILHYIRLQSNVRQFRSISKNLNSNNLKVNATTKLLLHRCGCCRCYSYCYYIWNDVPQNITSIVRNTAIWQAYCVSERRIRTFIFVLLRYAFFLFIFHSW